jgi:hypothetical protein
MLPITIPTTLSYPLSDIHFHKNKEKKEPGLALRLMQKIADFVKKIFSVFLFRKKESPFSFSSRQIRMIRQAQADRAPIKAKHIIATVKEEKKSLSITKPCLPENPSLASLSEFIQAFSQLSVCECIYQDKLLPEIPKWGAQLSESVAQIPDWNQIFLRLKESAIPIMKGLQALDDPAVTLIIQQLLHILVNQEKDDVEKMLLEKLAFLCDNERITEEQKRQAQSLIDPVLGWLYHSNNWIVNTTQPTKLHHFISDSFRFVNALSLEIQRGTLNPLFEQIQECIHTDFDQTIHETLELNTKPISLMLAGRLSDLIEHMPYTETYDLILHQIVSQTDGWIKAEERRLDQQSLITDSRKANQARARNANEVERQRAAQNLLHLVESDGGEESYLEKEFHRAFTLHEACHPKVASLIKSSENNEKEAIEEDIWRELIDKLFPQILPNFKQRLPHGLVIEVNGISKLLKSFVYPENLVRLKDLSNSLFEKVLEKSDVRDKENFREYFFAMSHLMIVEILQSKIKKTLAAHMQSLITNLSEKKYLDYLAVEYLFPSLVDKVFEGFVRAHLDRNSVSIAEYFHRMLEAEEDILSLDQSLLDFLYEEVQKNLIDFQMEECEIDRERFGILIQPVIKEIYQFILVKKQENLFEPLTLSQVKTRLREYFKVETVPVNSDYGKLIMNALFRIGSFGGSFVEKMINWFQGSLSEVTSQTLHPFSDNYTLLIDSIVATASSKLLCQKVIRETLFYQPTIEEIARQEGRVRTELPTQTRRMAAMVHDSLYRSLEARSIPFVKHLTPTTEKIDAVVHNVFQNFLKRPDLNKNLILHILDILNRSFDKSEEMLKAKQLIKERAQKLQSH